MKLWRDTGGALREALAADANIDRVRVNMLGQSLNVGMTDSNGRWCRLEGGTLDFGMMYVRHPSARWFV